MKCTKHMLVIGGALFAVGLVAYIGLPQFHAWIASASPLLIVLLCPLSMLFMMKGMHSETEHKAPSPEARDNTLLPQKSEANK